MTANSNNILSGAEEFAGKVLKNDFPPTMTYHNYAHTTEVVSAAREISRAHNLSPQDEEIVLLAAWFHDLGYSRGNIEHEQASTEMALNFLKEKEFSPEDAAKVGNCIMATRMPQNPENLLEEIICDADLAHLGGNDYLERSELLRQEREAVQGQDLDRLDWLISSRNFIEDHSFFTKYAREKYDNGKAANLETVKAEIRRISPEGSDPQSLLAEIQNLQEQLKQAKSKKKKAPGPDRSIDTMFKIVSRNHIDLSAMADTKANIMISINAIILSVVVSLLIRKLEEYPHFTVPALILTVVSLTTIVFAILATRPKIVKGTFTRADIDNRRTNLFFFGNFHEASLEDYEYGMREMMKDTDYLHSNFIRDIYYLGKVLGKKYRLLRICYTIFLFGFVIAILSFIIAEGFFASPYPY